MIHRYIFPIGRYIYLIDCYILPIVHIMCGILTLGMPTQWNGGGGGGGVFG